jgi:hypothetical protein
MFFFIFFLFFWQNYIFSINNTSINFSSFIFNLRRPAYSIYLLYHSLIIPLLCLHLLSIYSFSLKLFSSILSYIPLYLIIIYHIHLHLSLISIQFYPIITYFNSFFILISNLFIVTILSLPFQPKFLYLKSDLIVEM